MRTLSFAVLIGSCLLIASCGRQTTQPVINFIGIGTGTLTTDVDTIQYKKAFKATDVKLVAVVSFATIDPGSEVMATWFSPDDRSMPLGRTTIQTQKGANIARFSIASNEGQWKPAPYMVRIDASTGQGLKKKTASGSMSFFIGMKDKDIRDYQKEYAEWEAAMKKEQAEAAKAAELEAKKAAGTGAAPLKK